MLERHVERRPAVLLVGRGHERVALTEALRLWDSSELAAKVFGEAVVSHYAQAARAELAAFETAVTDWERVRGFERL